MNLNECKAEMQSIIRELRSIESGVKCDFVGIGEQLCGDCIDKIADKYDYISRELNEIDNNFISSLIESLL